MYVDKRREKSLIFWATDFPLYLLLANFGDIDYFSNILCVVGTNRKRGHENFLHFNYEVLYGSPVAIVSLGNIYLL